MEDRLQAQRISAMMMEYWLGRITKLEAATSLGMKPLRFWQLSQQAILGMNAGLLLKPARRGVGQVITKEQQIKELEKKVKKLEKVIATQRKLIEVLKTLPGNKHVKLKADKRGRKQNGLPKGTQGKSGPVVKNGAVRESEDSGSGAGGDPANTSGMEEASREEI